MTFILDAYCVVHLPWVIRCLIYVRIPRTSRQRAGCQIYLIVDWTVSKLFRQSEHNYLDTLDLLFLTKWKYYYMKVNIEIFLAIHLFWFYRKIGLRHVGKDLHLTYNLESLLLLLFIWLRFWLWKVRREHLQGKMFILYLPLE